TPRHSTDELVLVPPRRSHMRRAFGVCRVPGDLSIVGAPAPGAKGVVLARYTPVVRGRAGARRSRGSLRTPLLSQRRAARSVGARRWTPGGARSRAARLPPAAGWLTRAVTAQPWPLLSRVMPAMARTLRRVPVLLWAWPATGVLRRRRRMVPSIAARGREATHS